ncbi:MAG: polymer-forming cytoskeletal protein [Christensenellales bacterium]|jgi:predicted acyltransferase (DUF342 family)
MLKSRRGSTLVMALFMLAFVVIVGSAAVLIAGVSARQTNNTISNRQADFTAKSVLDSVFSKIISGEINPALLPESGAHSIDGSGQSNELGDYAFSITRHGAAGSELYKIAVSAEYVDSAANIYGIIQGFESEEPAPSKKFENFALGTGFSGQSNSLNPSHITGSLALDIGNDTLYLRNSGSLTGSINIIGGLEIGAYTVGVQGKSNVINATEQVRLQNNARIYADVNSGENVSMSGDVLVDGDINTNGNLELTGSSSSISGRVYALGDITLNGNSELKGDVYCGGNVTISNSARILGNVYALGNVVMNNGSIGGDVYSNKNMQLTGRVSGHVRALGDIDTRNLSQALSITANGDVHISTATIKTDVFAGGNIGIGVLKLLPPSSAAAAHITGKAVAGGNISVSKSSSINGELHSGGDITFESSSSMTGPVYALGSFSFKGWGSFNGDINAGTNCAIIESSSFTSHIVIGGNADIRKVTVNGSLFAKGNGYFEHNNLGQRTVTGTITLGGELLSDPAQANTIEYADPEQMIDPLIPQQPPAPLKALKDMEPVKVNVTIEAEQWPMPADKMAEAVQVSHTINFSSTSGASYPISGNDHIINHSCTLVIPNSGSTWGKNIVFDATEKDIYILLKPSGSDNTVTIPNGVDLLTKGDNNVFIFLDDGNGIRSKEHYVNLTTTGNSFFGRYEYHNRNIPIPDPLRPNLYIIQNNPGIVSQPSRVTLGSNVTLYGYIYAPHSLINLAGNRNSTYSYKIYGAVVGSQIEIGSNQTFAHYASPLDEDIEGPGPGGPPSGQTSAWALIGIYAGD